MYERFTERARQVLVLAQQEARSLGHNCIGTEHLLLGLLGEGEGIAARVLAANDVGRPVIRSAVARIPREGKEAPVGQIPFTPRARKVCELSLREALSLGHNYIGTEHILLGLVRENDILLDFDADSEKIRNEVIRMLSGPGGRQKRQKGAKETTAPQIRSPERIRPVLVEVEEYWKAHPDLRLAQLICNLANAVQVDPYAIEDGELLDAIWRSREAP